MAPPQRRRSFGPVSPKRIYRSLSVKLRGGASHGEAEHSDWRKRLGKGPADYACLWDTLESEDTLAVQHLLSRERETDERVNAVTEFGLVPLDVAALTHNASLLKVLVKAGAKHNPNSDHDVSRGKTNITLAQLIFSWAAKLFLRAKKRKGRCIKLIKSDNNNIYNVTNCVTVECRPIAGWSECWSECIGVTVRRRDQASAVRRISQQITDPELLTENSSSVRKVSVSRGLKQLFHSSRFVRLLQKGVYLACVFYQKECVLVSCDERLPLVEVQCCSASVTQDFLWFTKASVGCVDLGQVYFEPLKDRQGNDVLLVTLREVTTPLTPSDPPLHWVPVSTLEKHQIQTPMLPEPTAVELLTERLKEMLAYHRRSQHRAQSGLYVCVLKLCSSVKQLRVLVSHRLPSMPFCCRVRNRPHVTREEWAWLQRHAVGGACGSDDAVIDSSGVEDFVKELRSPVIQLLTKLNIPLERKRATSADSFGDLRITVRASPPSNQSLWAPYPSSTPKAVELPMERAGLMGHLLFPLGLRRMTRCQSLHRRVSLSPSSSGDEDLAALPPLGIEALSECNPELTDMLSRAAEIIDLECPGPSRLDDWFHGAARPGTFLSGSA
ncbi:unnamed protein product [Leuciscus chuanchicus]